MCCCRQVHVFNRTEDGSEFFYFRHALPFVALHADGNDTRGLKWFRLKALVALFAKRAVCFSHLLVTGRLNFSEAGNAFFHEHRETPRLGPFVGRRPGSMLQNIPDYGLINGFSRIMSRKNRSPSPY